MSTSWGGWIHPSRVQRTARGGTFAMGLLPLLISYIQIEDGLIREGDRLRSGSRFGEFFSFCFLPLLPQLA